MTQFKKHRRKQIAELRPVTQKDVESFKAYGDLFDKNVHTPVSVSQEDSKNGSPKIGDMIARNPKNHRDQWLVNEQYYNDNFELIE